ncbi:hypothetical protein PL8927_760177 [Planktothrix serta PCC 8927]|uniref:Uncharacterized protein n=1 Tax=Planktothrix serta PCC 8927 TaxID=671068 RepID=A0A7Z9BWZ6_9CYAN|nr:hypothetical protein [Planktothrix serta]VXD22925.1 hypothetical protein PL8927_760177 [Planktothrix serta PCC 8927]
MLQMILPKPPVETLHATSLQGEYVENIYRFHINNSNIKTPKSQGLPEIPGNKASDRSCIINSHFGANTEKFRGQKNGKFSKINQEQFNYNSIV